MCVIMYVTEVSSIATKKLKTATDPNSNGNVRKAVCLVVLAVFNSFRYISLLATHCRSHNKSCYIQILH